MWWGCLKEINRKTNATTTTTKHNRKETKITDLVKLRSLLPVDTLLCLKFTNPCLSYSLPPAPAHTPAMYSVLAELARKLSVNHMAAWVFKFKPCVETRKLAQGGSYKFSSSCFLMNQLILPTYALTSWKVIVLVTFCCWDKTLTKSHLWKNVFILADGSKGRIHMVDVLVTFL